MRDCLCETLIKGTHNSEASSLMPSSQAIEREAYNVMIVQILRNDKAFAEDVQQKIKRLV